MLGLKLNHVSKRGHWILTGWRPKIQKTSISPITGICKGDLPVSDGLPSQRDATSQRCDMETLSALLTFCEWNLPVSNRFSSTSFSNARLWFCSDITQQAVEQNSSCRWFEMPWLSCNVTIMKSLCLIYMTTPSKLRSHSSNFILIIWMRCFSETD